MKVNGSDITIEIGASSDQATQKIHELTDALRECKSVLNSGWNNPIGGIGGGGGSGKGVSKGLDDARQKAGLLAQTLSSLQRIAFYRVIRSAIKEIGKAFSEGAENAYWYSKTVGGAVGYVAEAFDQVASAGFKMSNQLGASLATLKATVTPILIELANLVIKVADFFTQLFAVLGGKTTYLKAVDYTKEAYENTNKGAKAAKEWKNQLLGFDEINKLTEPSSGSGGGGKAAEDYENMFKQAQVGTWAQMIKDHITDLELFASGALLGIGAALAFSGANVPLGLALIGVGAYKLVKTLSENGEDITATIKSKLSAIEMIAFGAMFGVGAVLTFTGANVPLGIALMAAGAIGMANVAALNWDDMPKNIKRVIKDIDAILGVSLLGIGAILTFTGGNLPLGIGLMAAGAGMLAAAVAISWNEMPDKVKKQLQALGQVVSSSLIALGSIFIFVPGMQALGIGMLIAGGVTSLATAFSFDPAGTINALLHPLDTLKQAFLDLWNVVIGVWNDIVNFFNGFNTQAQNIQADGSIYLQGFATGGFPEDGQLFRAREGGSPEYVGSIGRHTAVANNGQIVEGIAAGVYDAVTSAMGGIQGGNQPVEVRVYLDSREIKAGQQRVARATGGA